MLLFSLLFRERGREGEIEIEIETDIPPPTREYERNIDWLPPVPDQRGNPQPASVPRLGIKPALLIYGTTLKPTEQHWSGCKFFGFVSFNFEN